MPSGGLVDDEAEAADGSSESDEDGEGESDGHDRYESRGLDDSGRRRPGEITCGSGSKQR